MGACISANAKAGAYSKNLPKEKGSSHHHYKNRQSRPQSGHFSGPIRRSAHLRPVKIIRDPAGDNIHEKYEFGKELGR
ncbi:hypothetical protein CRG98_005426, partial [Punica granatum]